MAGSTISTFSADIRHILGVYGEEINNAVSETIREEAPNIVKEIKKESPKRTGEYSKGWSMKLTDNRFATNLTVYNGDHYQLNHLLEFGHELWQGGRTKANPFMGKVQKRAENKIVHKVWEKVGL